MRINDVIIELCKAHSPAGDDDLTDIQAQIKKDYSDIQYSDAFFADPESKITYKNKLKKFFENPYTRLGLVFVYLWLFRAIGDWKNGSSITKEEF